MLRRGGGRGRTGEERQTECLTVDGPFMGLLGKHGHHSAMGRMDLSLCGKSLAQDLSPAVHDRSARVIAAALDAENQWPWMDSAGPVNIICKSAGGDWGWEDRRLELQAAAGVKEDE